MHCIANIKNRDAIPARIALSSNSETEKIMNNISLNKRNLERPRMLTFFVKVTDAKNAYTTNGVIILLSTKTVMANPISTEPKRPQGKNGNLTALRAKNSEKLSELIVFIRPM
tara:strand:+ start:74 stop:412 length:339 start_codon:yes stop_codon:yes gene_type:complete